MIIVVAELAVRAKMEEKFRQAVSDVTEASLVEPGSISYGAYYDVLQKDRVMFVERWRDEAALQQHFETTHFIAFRERISPLVTNASEVVAHYVERVETL
jgi:quinol monooxygenase YgiN